MRISTVLLFACLVAVACQRSAPPASPAAPSTPPAKVVRGEADLTTLQLTLEAEARLGITTAPVERRAVDHLHWLPGRTVLPPGAATTVNAPLAGRLLVAPGASLSAGAAVAAGTAVLLLVPMAGPDARANLEMARETSRGALERATAEQSAARIALARAEQLLAGEVGSARAVDEAKTVLQVATGARTAAEAELATMARVLGAFDSEGGGAVPIVVDRDATVTAIYAFSGQVVPAGAPLFDLEDARQLWLRVDVPLALHDRLAVAGPVRFSSLAERNLDQATVATPVIAPKLADPLAASIVLHYGFDNSGGDRRPGERCAVAIAEIAALDSGADSAGKRLVLPAAAIVHDAYGGAWVYENSAPHEYRRRRVDVDFVADAFAVLRHGPPVATEVVTAGTAELFGVEFGVGK